MFRYMCLKKPWFRGEINRNKLLNKLTLFKRSAWRVMFISSVDFGYLWLLNTIWVFWVDLFLTCLWLPKLELFLKCSYFWPKIEARWSYKTVPIYKKRVVRNDSSLQAQKRIDNVEFFPWLLSLQCGRVKFIVYDQ